ncbi:glutathione S-transferase isoform X2 [Halyomorpha halys]|uniref:glutathione S-transferase isoform X2 n=1 Tax=Halyomorpha halys TaxID=286706 RepID=UPI0006D50A86|nr:glutathione S-transferase isoform X2 [Halyomorpha halys]
MPEYKLTYFNGRGLGESIRFILSYMGKEFQDNRITTEWPQFKEKTPFGKLPILEIDDKVLYQSLAILKYLATQAGLAGNNAEEKLEIDMVVGAYGDLASELSRYFQTANSSDKEKLKETIINDSVPFYMSKFETILKKNGGYLANGKLSWAELYVVGHSSSFPALIGIDLTEKYPFWKELTERVYSLPGIKEWIRKRPESDF